MNITLIIRVNELSDMPNALDKVIKDVKSDINIMGEKTNSQGITEEGHDYNYFIDNTNYKSLRQFVEPYRIDYF